MHHSTAACASWPKGRIGKGFLIYTHAWAVTAVPLTRWSRPVWRPFGASARASADRLRGSSISPRPGMRHSLPRRPAGLPPRLRDVARVKDIAGLRFGHILAVAATTRRDKKGRVYWSCTCDCGARCEVRGDLLRGAQVTCSNACPLKGRRVGTGRPAPEPRRAPRPARAPRGCWDVPLRLARQEITGVGPIGLYRDTYSVADLDSPEAMDADVAAILSGRLGEDY